MTHLAITVSRPNALSQNLGCLLKISPDKDLPYGQVSSKGSKAEQCDYVEQLHGLF